MFVQLDEGGVEFPIGGNRIEAADVVDRNAGLIRVAPNGRVFPAIPLFIHVTEVEDRLVRDGDDSVDPELGTISVQLLGAQRHPGLVEGEEAADPIIEGAEALVAHLKGALFVFGQAQLGQVILGSDHGFAVNFHGGFLVQFLDEVERLDAVGTGITRAEAFGVGRGVAGDRGDLARDLDVAVKGRELVGGLGSGGGLSTDCTQGEGQAGNYTGAVTEIKICGMHCR